MKRFSTFVAALFAAATLASCAPAPTDQQHEDIVLRPAKTAGIEDTLTSEMLTVAAPESRSVPDFPTLNVHPLNCANCVAITFDDGPTEQTERLLNILDQMDARVSFFVVGGNADARPDLIQRMLERNDTIANHSYTHPHLPQLGDASISYELASTTESITDAVYWPPRWMRPPYGEFDQRVVATAGAQRLAVAMWDVDTADWQHRDPSTTCRIAVEHSEPGSIILMHDIHATTVDAVPCVIDGLRARGLRPVSLDYMVKHPVAGQIYERRPVEITALSSQ